MTSRLSGRRRELLAAGAIAALVAVAAGCSGSASAGAPASPGPADHDRPSASSQHAVGQHGVGQHVVMSGTNALRFDPMTVHVHTGKVRITLKDMGVYPHNVVIPALGVTSATVTGDPGSGSVSFTVTFPHPGRYPFHCQYHGSAGMVGVFVAA